MCTRRACNWKINIREFLCVIHAHGKYHKEAHELHKIIPASQPCETDVLCIWELLPPKEKAVISLGPIVGAFVLPEVGFLVKTRGGGFRPWSWGIDTLGGSVLAKTGGREDPYPNAVVAKFVTEFNCFEPKVCVCNVN